MTEANTTPNTTEEPRADEAKEAPERRSPEELQKILHDVQVKAEAKAKIAMEAMREGKGRLELETPFTVGGVEIKELAYDFMVLTGMEYTDAMDSDSNANGSYKITYRQALALFAKAAAKQTERVDMEDIIQNLGATDAVEGVQLATLFFNASTRAGRMRISKR